MDYPINGKTITVDEGAERREIERLRAEKAQMIIDLEEAADMLTYNFDDWELPDVIRRIANGEVGPAAELEG